MASKSLEERVIDCVVRQLGVSVDHVKPESAIIDDLGADSLDIVELMMEVEDTLGISIPEEDCEKVSTIRDLIDVAFKYWKDT